MRIEVGGTTWKALRWLLAIACLGYIAHFYLRHRQDFDLALSFGPRILLAIAALHLVFLLLRALRFQAVLNKSCGSRVPYGVFFRLMMQSVFLNSLLPQLGNVYRSLRLKRDFGVAHARYVGAHLAMTWLDVAFNFLTAALILAVWGRDLRLGGYRVLPIAAAVALLAAVAPLAADHLFRLMPPSSGRLGWARERTAEMLRASTRGVFEPAYLLWVFLLGLAVFAVYGTVYHLGFRALGATVGIAELALFFALFKLSTYVHVTAGGNLGLRELAFGFLAEGVGVGLAEGVVVSALVRVVSTAFILGLGTLFGGMDLYRRRGELADAGSQQAVAELEGGAEPAAAIEHGAQTPDHRRRVP